jgi:hypothetical protein
MKRLKATLILLTAFVFLNSSAQVNCSTLDINKVPGKWVWQKGKYENQWQICEPIRKEMQRIMPVALQGLHATYSIAYGDNPVFWYTKSPTTYICYLMLKDYECLTGYNVLRPEGETGCWIYFDVNSTAGVDDAPGRLSEVIFNESTISVGNIEVKTDAAGNKILYSSSQVDLSIRERRFFSARKDLPWRKMTNIELFTAYKIHHEKKISEEIAKFEKILAEDEKKYNNLSAAEKQKKSYMPDIIKKNKEYLNEYINGKAKVISWYSSAIKKANLNDTAYVTDVTGFEFSPEKLEAAPGNGYNVWVDNLDFFDKAKSKDIPQWITMRIRRQDGDLTKKNFMDLFFSQFNMDVLAKMVGEPAKKPGSINTLSASLNDVKSESKVNQNTITNYNYSFEKSTGNQFPSGWNGMKNSTVQQYENKNWLAFTKDGYCYPQQFNKEIKDNFNLTFDLSWNKDISYYSGLFTVAVSEIPYDNAAEKYTMDDNQGRLWCFYESYVGNFNRVMIWFDPYSNGGGTLEVYSYDYNENIGVKKRITLPEFYRTKNSHQLKIQRKGNSLQVFINNKKEADIENVFIPSVKYNLYTFSRYKGGDDKNDVFYINNIKAHYEK